MHEFARWTCCVARRSSAFGDEHPQLDCRPRAYSNPNR
jgi:hypothetical protein